MRSQNWKIKSLAAVRPLFWSLLLFASFLCSADERKEARWREFAGEPKLEYRVWKVSKIDGKQGWSCDIRNRGSEKVTYLKFKIHFVDSSEDSFDFMPGSLAPGKSEGGWAAFLYTTRSGSAPTLSVAEITWGSGKKQENAGNTSRNQNPSGGSNPKRQPAPDDNQSEPPRNSRPTPAQRPQRPAPTDDATEREEREERERQAEARRQQQREEQERRESQAEARREQEEARRQRQEEKEKAGEDRREQNQAKIINLQIQLASEQVLASGDENAAGVAEANALVADARKNSAQAERLRAQAERSRASAARHREKADRLQQQIDALGR